MINQAYGIAVCDDQETDRERTRIMAEEICRKEKIPGEISCFSRAKDLLEQLKEGRHFDLLLLDVMMPEQDGIALSRRIREEDRKTDIIFLSVNKEMALMGYEVSAARYLAKPVEREKLREGILHCYARYRKDRDILLHTNGGIKKVSPGEIYYIEIVGRKSRIYLESEEWDTSLSMSRLEEMLLSHGFVRCHQSFLVNCRYVRTLQSTCLELAGGRIVPVSKHRIKEVRQAFGSV